MVRIRIDSYENSFHIGKVSMDGRNFSKRIYPVSSHTHLELPFLVVNLSVS